jgi:hypothetical protein
MIKKEKLKRNIKSRFTLKIVYINEKIIYLIKSQLYIKMTTTKKKKFDIKLLELKINNVCEEYKNFFPIDMFEFYRRKILNLIEKKDEIDFDNFIIVTNKIYLNDEEDIIKITDDDREEIPIYKILNLKYIDENKSTNHRNIKDIIDLIYDPEIFQNEFNINREFSIAITIILQFTVEKLFEKIQDNNIKKITKEIFLKTLSEFNDNSDFLFVYINNKDNEYMNYLEKWDHKKLFNKYPDIEITNSAETFLKEFLSMLLNELFTYETVYDLKCNLPKIFNMKAGIQFLRNLKVEIEYTIDIYRSNDNSNESQRVKKLKKLKFIK